MTLDKRVRRRRRKREEGITGLSCDVFLQLLASLGAVFVSLLVLSVVTLCDIQTSSPAALSFS